MSYECAHSKTNTESSNVDNIPCTPPPSGTTGRRIFFSPSALFGNDAHRELPMNFLKIFSYCPFHVRIFRHVFFSGHETFILPHGYSKNIKTVMVFMMYFMIISREDVSLLTASANFFSKVFSSKPIILFTKSIVKSGNIVQ